MAVELYSQIGPRLLEKEEGQEAGPRLARDNENSKGCGNSPLVECMGNETPCEPVLEPDFAAPNFDLNWL